MKTPTHYMAAAITVLAIFGTYSVQHNFADVIVMLFLGTTMFFLSLFFDFKITNLLLLFNIQSIAIYDQ